MIPTVSVVSSSSYLPYKSMSPCLVQLGIRVAMTEEKSFLVNSPNVVSLSSRYNCHGQPPMLHIKYCHALDSLILSLLIDTAKLFQ